jgi:hypothetical protein
MCRHRRGERSDRVADWGGRTLPDEANCRGRSRSIGPSRRDATLAAPADPQANEAPIEDGGATGEAPIVDPGLSGEDELLVVLRGIGAVMFLTTLRIIVARDGVERRPRTGIQSFDLDAIRHLRLELGRGPAGRIALWTVGGNEAVSMFFDARSLDRAHELIDRARLLIARLRRDDQDSSKIRTRDPLDQSGA